MTAHRTGPAVFLNRSKRAPWWERYAAAGPVPDR